MKIDKAKIISEKLTELELAEKQLDQFNNTEEFCSIRIDGENGAEKEYHFMISYKRNKDEIIAIRECITRLLENKIKKLHSEIDKL